MYGCGNTHTALSGIEKEQEKMSYSQVLISAREAKRLTQEQVATQAGVSRTQYVSMEGGQIPTPDRWRAVIEVLGVSEDDYLAGMDDDQRQKALNETRRGRRNPRPKTELGPVGFLKDPTAGASKRKLIGKMPDDSMEPAFLEGDDVWVETLEHARAGDLVAIHGGGQALVRRLVRIDEVRNEAVVEDVKTRTMTRVPLGDPDDEPPTIIYRVV